MEAIKTAGYEGKCEIGMDVAASEFKAVRQSNFKRPSTFGVSWFA